MMNHSSLSFARYRFRCHVVAAFVCLLFGGIQYFASMARTAAVRAELNSALNHRQSLVGQSEALMQRLESLQSEESRLREDLQSLREKIPYKADDHAFLESLANLAEEAGLEILGFQPSRAESDQQFEKVPVRISAVCNWSQLCQFLYQVKNTKRLCSVDEVRISVPEVGNEQLHLNLTLRIFSAFPKMMAQTEKGDLQ
jgi:Tfp pilus assembly protein PilO